MKGIYKRTLVDIVEKTPDGLKIQTTYGIINVKSDEVIEVPSAVYAKYVVELDKCDEYLDQIRKKQEEIKTRYYQKRLELSRANSRAWNKKQSLIQKMYYEALSVV